MPRPNLRTIWFLCTSLLLSWAASADAQRDPGDHPPNRIVVAGTPVYTQVLVDLGATQRLAGVTDSPDNPPEVRGVPQVGPSMNPSLEQILALRPDVVVGVYDPLREQLRHLGVRVVTAGQQDGTIQGIADVLAIIRALGALSAEQHAADELIAKLQADIAQIELLVRDRRRPQVAVLYPVGGGAPYVAGSATPEDEIIRLAGGENLFAGLHRHPQVSYEEIVRGDPEFILTEPAYVQRLLANPLLAEVRAVRGGHIIGVRAATLASSRLTEGLRTLARGLHQDAFSR